MGAFRKIHLLLLLAPGISAACDKATFKSESKKEASPEAVTTTCNGAGEYPAENLDIRIPEYNGVQVFLTGEFCPQAPAQLRVLFLIDYSLSIFNPEDGQGNDPPVNGSCGRLKAVQAIVGKYLKDTEIASADVKIGAVRFSSEAALTVPLTGLAEVQEQLSVDNFCKGDGGTNYKVAFDKALEVLKDEPGSKIIYLISDGLPTEGGGGKRDHSQRHRDAAQTAANAMRSGISSMTMNTIFLGNIHDVTEEGFEPESFLKEVTGDPDRVRMVETADKLAEEILNLENPPVALNVESPKAWVSAEGKDEQDVGFRYFRPHDSRPQVWSFRTNPFDAFPGQAKKTSIRVEAVDEDGQTFEVLFRIQPKSSGDTP